jgi:hypothetical protein
LSIASACSVMSRWAAIHQHSVGDCQWPACQCILYYYELRVRTESSVQFQHSPSMIRQTLTSPLKKKDLFWGISLNVERQHGEHRVGCQWTSPCACIRAEVTNILVRDVLNPISKCREDEAYEGQRDTAIARSVFGLINNYTLLVNHLSEIEIGQPHVIIPSYISSLKERKKPHGG